MDGQSDCILTPESMLAFEALYQLGVGVLLVNEAGYITYANPAASEVLSPLYPIGGSLMAILGLSGSGAARKFRLDGDADPPPIRTRLPDGRTIECRVRSMDGRGNVVSLVDVTAHADGMETAGKDPLTRLADRAGFRVRGRMLVQRAGRLGGSAAVFCLGLDRFKIVNETLGHAIGDELLGKVADRLRGAARAGDVVARIGGDEFALIQADAGQPDGAEALSKRLVDLIGRPYVIRGQMINIGVSVGVAVLPQDGNDIDVLLQHADLALRRAKGEGKGTYRFFEPAMDASSQARRSLEVELRRALALQQFEVAFQPQIRFDPDVLTGFEALIRWRHPGKGDMSPTNFLPLAEEIGLIDQLGQFVLEAACREAASWPEHISIAVNISPLQFRNPHLVDVVRQAIEVSGLVAGRLELEITEGALLSNTEGVLHTLNELKRLGVRLAMDDFGTGYSSLSYLQKFPFDKVKIDQSFVRGSDFKPECEAIVRAVAALGQSLGLPTIAEGVETLQQLERVRAAGCTAVQGYLTGRPMPPVEASALAQSRRWVFEAAADPFCVPG